MRTVLLVIATGLLGLTAAAAVASTVAVRIIAINDFHGHLESGENVVTVPDPADPARMTSLRSGGAAQLATRIAQLRAERPLSVVVSSGDLIGASPLVSGLFHDEPTIEVMNAIGIDLNAVGNHEFSRRFFTTRDPLGHRIKLGGPGLDRTVDDDRGGGS